MSESKAKIAQIAKPEEWAAAMGKPGSKIIWLPVVLSSSLEDSLEALQIGETAARRSKNPQAPRAGKDEFRAKLGGILSAAAEKEAVLLAKPFKAALAEAKKVRAEREAAQSAREAAALPAAVDKLLASGKLTPEAAAALKAALAG